MGATGGNSANPARDHARPSGKAPVRVRWLVRRARSVAEWWGGVRGGGLLRASMARTSPHPRPLPTARKSLRGEGSGEAVLTSHDQQKTMERYALSDRAELR